MGACMCVRAFVPEKGLLTARLQMERGTDCTHLILPGEILCTVATHHKNQVDSELEVGVVYADLIDYIKNIKRLRKKHLFFLSYLSFICRKCSKQLL